MNKNLFQPKNVGICVDVPNSNGGIFLKYMTLVYVNAWFKTFGSINERGLSFYHIHNTIL